MKTTVICATCDLRLPPGVEFCPQCGQDFCPSCGIPVESDAVNCPGCGTEFELHCPRCDAEVMPSDLTCHSCGLSFGDEEFDSDPGDVLDQTAIDDHVMRKCQYCTALYYLEDGFCRECGQLFCPSCGNGIVEDDDSCSQCGFALYFQCPLCAFELTAGTEICPNCDAFFPSHCPNCQARVNPGGTSCGNCSSPLIIRQRTSARTVKSINVGDSVLRIVACPNCGRNFDPIKGECPACHLHICSQCQMVLDTDEIGCPRCGLPDGIEQAVDLCPNCHRILTDESGECLFCQLTHCPECLNLIPEDAATCPECGAEFEFLCPSCSREVGADDSQCPHCGFSFDHSESTQSLQS